MPETLYMYQQVAPWAVALLLFPCGLVAGSFCTVLHHRLLSGKSIIHPGSACPSCHHSLGLVDLIPVLSYMWLRGHCRFCHATIPSRYVLLELATGLMAGLAGYAGGWGAGFGALGLWTAAVALTSLRRQRSQAGVSLVEVLVAVSLLVTVILPLMDLGADLRAANAFQRQLAVISARSKLEELGDEMLNSDDNHKPRSGSDVVSIGALTYDRVWTIAELTPASPWLLQAVVTMSCDPATCDFPDVVMTSIVAKEPIP